MSDYARELVREAIGYSRCGYLDIERYDRLVNMVDGLLALESETNEKFESERARLCVCWHSEDWHGNDGTGPCGQTKSCRAGACKQFRAAG